MNKHEHLGADGDRSPFDRNANGIDDRIEPPPVNVEAAARELRHRRKLCTHSDPLLCCGDPDACWEQAESAGDELPGASSPTPDQNCVDMIGEALGLTYGYSEMLRFGEKELARDSHRWELDPASADDYVERMHEAAAHPPRHFGHKFIRSH